ncbi:hypothetical protein KY342_00740 [Candidatus Woesearchaeota archaeon]|nr:hypothetical protein [Candidatus Woesearchaeota archaeon]
MDLNENDDSLYRKRSSLGLCAKIVTTGALLVNVLGGCFAKDIAYVRSPDAIPTKVSAYENKLETIAEGMKLYDSTTKQYDNIKVRAEVEKQLKKDPANPSGYKDLMGYDIDQLLATRAALDKVVEQNREYIKANAKDPLKAAEVARRRLENSELETKKREYGITSKKYHFLGANDTSKSDDAGKRERKKHFVTLGIMAYGAGEFDNWEKFNELRKKDFTSILGDRDNYDWITERYPDDVRKAHLVRSGKCKRNGKRGFWATLGIGLLWALLSNQEESNGGGPGPNIGGEQGNPTGK